MPSSSSSSSMPFVPRKPSQGQPVQQVRLGGVPTLPPAIQTSASQPMTARRVSDNDDSNKLAAIGGSHSARLMENNQTMTGTEASKAYTAYLSEHERTEILDYDDIYYYGQNCLGKIEAPIPGRVNHGYDDERGDLVIISKDQVAYRYELLSILGKGSFGQVAKAIDHKTGQHVALKIIRNKKRFHTQAEVEVNILKHLRDKDPEGKYGIVRMLDNFVFRHHVCLTYELLSINLYEHMKLNRFHPIPLSIVKRIGASLLISLAFMWRENIVHCDLKPENILLRQPDRTAVKVIDLGSACFENERLYVYIQSRFYRAPEVIMEINYTKRIDLWSYACVLAELASGYPLFAGENETEQLACMMEVLGIPPRHVIDQSPRKNVFFNVMTYQPILVPNSRKKIREPDTKSLTRFVGVEEGDPFVDFLMMFLQYDPDERPSPESAMTHPWICDAYVGVQAKVPVTGRKKRHSSQHQSRRSVSSPRRSVGAGGSSSSATAGTDPMEKSDDGHLPSIRSKRK